jgi:hypothetical protein
MAGDLQSLLDDILNLQRSGAIQQQFSAAEIARRLRHRYTKQYVMGTLATYSADTGNMVRRGFKPRFRRVRKGVYEVCEVTSNSVTNGFVAGSRS